MYGNRLAGKQAHYSRTTGSPVLEPWEGGWSDVHPLREAEDKHQNAMEEDGLSWIIVEDPVKRMTGEHDNCMGGGLCQVICVT